MLRHCLPPSVRGVLDELPETLDGTYERVLKEINKANREHAHRLLHCLTVAMRPLRVEELAEVLAVDFGAVYQGGIPKLNLDWRWADQHQAVLSTCSSLIAIVDDGDSQVVQFSHFSVKEFLTSDRLARSSENISQYHILLESAHTHLAQACLGVLLRLDDDVDEDNAKDIPLAEYAARYWVDHAQLEKVASHIQETMEFFFDADKPHWAGWIRVHNIDAHWEFYSDDHGANAALPLYYASLCGFYDLVEHLISKNTEHISVRGGRLVTPLVAALYKEHFQVAELLFQHGADLDVRGGFDNTPLTIACSIGPEDVVPWLLDHGTDINARTEWGSTSLHLAALHGQSKSFQALLEYGADVSARDEWGSTPLHYLSQMGQCPTDRPIEGAQLLLKHGADIGAKDNQSRTPRQLALDHGYDEMARFLSEHAAT